MSWINQKEKERKRLMESIKRIILKTGAFKIKYRKTEEEFFSSLSQTFTLNLGRGKELIRQLDVITERVHAEGEADYQRDAWSNYLNTRGRKEVKVLTNLVDENRQQLIKDIRERIGKQKGTWRERYIKVLQDMDKVGDSIAERIARTEAHKLFTETQLKVYEVHGVERKRWVALADARPTHSEVNGVTLLLHENFNVGNDTMTAPGLGTTAEENINCRCVLRSVGKFKEFKGVI